MERIDRVMVDIETLGTEPGCAILSVGAVRFDEDGLGDEQFIGHIDLESCQDAGLDIDAGTLAWWLDQDDAVQGVLTGGQPLADVLAAFSEWYGDADEVWAYSPAFDCSVLEAAYDAVGQDAPWSYRDERCARTLAALPCAVAVEQDGDRHDALDDATWQARAAARTLAALDGGDHDA